VVSNKSTPPNVRGWLTMYRRSSGVEGGRRRQKGVVVRAKRARGRRQEGGGWKLSRVMYRLASQGQVGGLVARLRLVMHLSSSSPALLLRFRPSYLAAYCMAIYVVGFIVGICFWIEIRLLRCRPVGGRSGSRRQVTGGDCEGVRRVTRS